MLDTLTKKRIDDCRDILVGKLPDPKAQIEQITIGLIYKFMDDMDKDAIELGGEAKFFKDYEIIDPKDNFKKIAIPFEKYSWDNLFDTRTTADEMLRLYSAAIEGMEKNPNLPQLFRDIFNNAYLPYRDPETLKLFLKTINEFEYTHSEKLGDAFEYLLSVMGSQGDAGQFRTPRHIIDFLVAIVDPSKSDTIFDPACGTAGFLISAFKYIKQKNNNELTPDQRKKLIQNFVGYDISPDMVRLSLVNLYLHGFSEPHIFEYDTLSKEDRWNETFDVILANPPFMSPKGGIRPHKRFTVQSKRSEVLFIDYIAEHLNPKGKAGVIVPEGVIFQSGKAYKEIRKMLVENYLYAVVSLPAGVFNPYSGVKTSILFLDKELAKKSNEILFIKIENDGYSLGAQRGAVKGGQLNEAINTTITYKKSILEGNDFESTNLAHAVEKKVIGKSGDFNLSGDRYKKVKVLNSDFKFVSLSEICDVRDGTHDSPKYVEKGYPLITSKNIKNGYIDFSKVNYISKEDFDKVSKRSYVNDGDIIMPMIGTIGNPIVVNKEREFAIKNVALIKFERDSRINNYFLKAILGSDYFSENYRNYSSGSTQKFISLTFIRKLQIPLPLLSIQEEIVAEIEGYQKIIDGAKTVVDNYKPKIDIDPEWEMVDLGSICKNLDSKRVPITKSDREEGPYPYYGASGQVDSVNDYLFDEDLLLVSEDGANLRARVYPIAFSISGKTWVNNHAHVLQFKENYQQKFIEFYLNSISLEPYITGSAQPKMNQKNLNRILVPNPQKDIQKSIVNEINEELKAIDSNKQLIRIFEMKIKNIIAKVWGE